MAAVVEGGPPEDPAEDVDVLFVDLFGGEDFVRVFGGVVAAQAQGAAGEAVEVFHAQHAVVFEGVHFAVDDVGAAAVYADE